MGRAGMSLDTTRIVCLEVGKKIYPKTLVKEDKEDFI